MNLNYVLQQFKTEKEIEPYGNGHINDTYVVNPARFIIQRINTNIFTNPDELMDNIENVIFAIDKAYYIQYNIFVFKGGIHQKQKEVFDNEI